MARAKRSTAASAGKVEQTPPAEAAPSVDSGNENRSEEVMVVQTTEEPVRMGGHILTEQGWVVEDGGLVPDTDNADEGDPAPETEQE